MIGTGVHNLSGQSVGKMTDLLIGDGGALKAVVLDVGGVLGVGSRRIAVRALSAGAVSQWRPVLGHAHHGQRHDRGGCHFQAGSDSQVRLVSTPC
ncbi:PRC-barrel domain-containing protein [Methylobacterium sp. E-005]|nr:PRC-barrel domain-containing protein [Methylobacterium sp. E-005]MCJ2088059.1 PRC-barrel domain-containing protein [Methylobacterium sp. E-005]